MTMEITKSEAILGDKTERDSNSNCLAVFSIPISPIEKSVVNSDVQIFILYELLYKKKTVVKWESCY